MMGITLTKVSDDGDSDDDSGDEFMEAKEETKHWHLLFTLSD